MISEQLNVAYVLEGSVRKAGNQVRISAQLIEARSDTQLWSESYDRAIDDIFVTQDEIEASVVCCRITSVFFRASPGPDSSFLRRVWWRP